MQLSNLTGLFVAGRQTASGSRGAVNRCLACGVLRGMALTAGVGVGTMKVASHMCAIRVRRPRALLLVPGRAVWDVPEDHRLAPSGVL